MQHLLLFYQGEDHHSHCFVLDGTGVVVVLVDDVAARCFVLWNRHDDTDCDILIISVSSNKVKKMHIKMYYKHHNCIVIRYLS